jgi:DNA-directed RNA polymerase
MIWTVALRELTAKKNPGPNCLGQALTRKYRDQLADNIRAERILARNKVLWRAIKDFDDETLAVKLLVAGISVCGGKKIGTDKDGEKNFTKIALWIGRNLCITDGEITFKVGAWGVRLLLTLPVFDLVGEDILVLNGGVNDFMDEVIARAVRNHPLLSPLSTPPEPWTQFRKGGLPVDHWLHGHVCLIRTNKPGIEDIVRKAIADGRMARVLDAINSLQAVAYTINEPVLDCIEKMEAANSPEWQTDIALARILVREDRFYTPLNMDTRGRIYGIPYFNFQRGDHVRGLFLFADGEPIEGRDVLWLYAHVANRADGNTWSDVQKPSKLSTPDRVSWTIKNEKTVRGIGEAVLAGDDPDRLPLSGLEEPCQFIAACVELVQALDRPDFPTRLPITLDATCSGLQHLCGMTRAEEGRLVNLTSSHRAEDFYAEVAAKVYLDNPDLRSLMQGESDRSIVKQPAMSYFYGRGSVGGRSV